ncbi:MAG TPA: polyprenyl synthetase family protein [Solirubrobacteraceae bacterium]|nr:polyprenyl synthetase family protein [Solirubrobacteraceae bacterium]
MSSAEEVLALVEAGGAHVPALMTRLEARLEALATSHGELLAEHAGATIRAGGKRLRPLLVFLAAGEKAEPNHDGVLRAAVAVELIHSATLVHDDVLDAAPLRRGRPTVVATAGRAIATATGDLLFSRAFAELAVNGRPDEIRVLSDASSGLAEGELLQREDAWNVDVPRDRYLHRCDLKTARLFQAACRLGALEGGGQADALGDFGRRIGLAFQLLDDVLDVSGPAERTGKHRGTDLLDGTVTLPSSWRASAIRSWRRSTFAPSGRPRRPRRSATRSRRPACWSRRARRRWRWWPPRRRTCRRSPTGSGRHWSWWRTRSRTGTPRSPSARWRRRRARS